MKTSINNILKMINFQLNLISLFIIKSFPLNYCTFCHDAINYFWLHLAFRKSFNKVLGNFNCQVGSS